MGNRVMERPNLSGGTVARHHVPKAVRRSRKRAVRKTAGALKPAELAEELRQTPAPQVATKAPKPRKLIERPSRKPEVQVVAKAPKPKPVTPVERPIRKPVPQITVTSAKPVKPIEQPSEKPVIQVAAKAPTTVKPLPSPKPAPEVAAKAPKRRNLFERLTQKRAPQVPPEVEKPAEPVEQTPPPVQEPAAEKARRMPVDTFEDGAIEWGIKREGEGKEPKDSGT